MKHVEDQASAECSLIDDNNKNAGYLNEPRVSLGDYVQLHAFEYFPMQSQVVVRTNVM